MRVAVVTTSWPRFEGDPSGHFVETEVRALTRCGEEVVVIAAEGGAFGWPGFAARVSEAPLRLLGAAGWIARARREVARGGFDRVVAHWALPSAWPIAMTDGPLLEVVSHGGDVRLLSRLPSAVRARLASAIASRAQTWRFVSTPLLDSLLRTLPTRAAGLVERVARVAPCAIDFVRPTEEAIAAKRARVGAPFAVCVARLVPSKRVDAAISWAIAEGRPLVIVGDGPERASLEKAARSKRPGGRPVHFVGRTTRTEALAWIASSAELVQPSRDEGLSTVAREAELLGVPVRSISPGFSYR
ncbi:MAG: glycosyltransferase family 4 protein [Polyangiaceae bacterium]